MNVRRIALAAVCLLGGLLVVGAAAYYTSPGHAAAAGQGRPRNLIFVICDQEAYRLFAKDDYHLPARRKLMRRGVTFRNHYIASAVCTPSRAAFLTGTTPQVNGVSDQMSFGFLPNLSPTRPNMGSILKGLGYHTAYFGKFELSLSILHANKSENTSTALQPYGFDIFNTDGDNSGGPYQGYAADAYFAGEAVRWLRGNAPALRQKGQPFFMVASFVNPHDIMFADTNPPGRPPVQKAVSKDLLTPPPKRPLHPLCSPCRSAHEAVCLFAAAAQHRGGAM